MWTIGIPWHKTDKKKKEQNIKCGHTFYRNCSYQRNLKQLQLIISINYKVGNGRLRILFNFPKERFPYEFF